MLLFSVSEPNYIQRFQRKIKEKMLKVLNASCYPSKQFERAKMASQ